jgi:hypothetical protein
MAENSIGIGVSATDMLAKTVGSLNVLDSLDPQAVANRLVRLIECLRIGHCLILYRRSDPLLTRTHISFRDAAAWLVEPHYAGYVIGISGLVVLKLRDHYAD